MTWRLILTLFVAALPASSASAAEPPSYSGIYPHLAYFNDEGECGAGAVVPWADRLWVVTYSPHSPNGSTDKLYEIDNDLRMIVRPESVGGTPANRMIHGESNQLFIGPYAIDKNRIVRVIPPSVMPGRLTGNARHLTDPAQKILVGTMEEGLYEVDVKTLAVLEIYPDANASGSRDGTILPGYHGKGLYSGQRRVVYTNNGEGTKEARVRPDVEAGVLAEWDGGDWTVVRRNQFTEVTGPGGIRGNANAAADPIWSVGFDHRSLIVMVRDGGTWHAYRLPKASHTYDGAHGWNTEWPRIREISAAGGGEEPDEPQLMTMHGMFWRFPRTFSAKNSAGIAPRSTYLKVVGDFCRWGDRVVLGCDDTAQREFLNTRKAKGGIASPGQSQSNLWFVTPEQLDELGPPIGRGAVWLDEPVAANVASEPFLFDGFDRRTAHLAHDADRDVTFKFEVDRDGRGDWRTLRSVTVPPRGYEWVEFAESETGAWVRVSTGSDCPHATAFFHFADADDRTTDADDVFDSLARDDDFARSSGGLLHARGENRRTLQVAAVRNVNGTPEPIGSYELHADMTLRPMNDAAAADEWLRTKVAVPADVLKIDAASVLYVDDAGKRWRLPRAPAFAADASPPFGLERVDREVATERDLFNAAGIFYELPAENAGGFAKIRPIATHGRRIHDYCSWRGLLVLSGVADDRAAGDPHVIRSHDERCAVWVGAIDDLWKLGKPVGVGGPWLKTAVRTGEPSDPYLMAGFDAKSLSLAHDGDDAIRMRVEVDVSGTGLWMPYRTFDVAPEKTITHDFPRAFQAYWLRVVSDADTTATAQLRYE
jgi:hypothetical protein